ncbi:MAG: class I SAM-dependent methyltransferase [Hyphomonadaceae bacterium]
MSANASQFVGDIPQTYDSGLVPNIFEDYAADIARRAIALKPASVLELAAGTGVVARKLRDGLPAETTLTITDLNAPMLEVARAKFDANENVAFAAADAMKLDYPDASFDVIVCQFGVMFFPDKQASFREALRVLKPGGAYLFNTWGAMGDNPFGKIAYETCVKFYPDNPPGFYKVPFSCADPAPLIADMEAAGFARVAHAAVAQRKKIADMAAFSRGIIFGNPLSAEIAARGGDAEAMRAEVEARLRAGLEGMGFVLPLKANVFMGRRPA